jgi:hypothetical protein
MSSSGDPGPFVLQRFFFNWLLLCRSEDSTPIGFIPAKMSRVCKKIAATSLRDVCGTGVHNPLRPYATRQAVRLSEGRGRMRLHQSRRVFPKVWNFIETYDSQDCAVGRIKQRHCTHTTIRAACDITLGVKMENANGVGRILLLFAFGISILAPARSFAQATASGDDSGHDKRRR